VLLDGKCHCGNIAFELDWPGAQPEIPARVCDCSFCVRHGGVWTSNPQASLEVTIGDSALISNYAFATRSATFHVCSRCGVVPFVTSEIAGRLHAVVNVNALSNLDPAWLRRSAASFAGEDAEARRARRERSWIGRVRIVAGAEK
jgi:hypothetical protein